MPQLKTGIWVDALIRRAEAGGAFACVVQRGDRDAGTVLVVIRAPATLHLYVPERNMEGARVWRPQVMNEQDLFAAIASRRDFDPDLIVVEIEDAEGRHFMDEPVLADPAAPADAAGPAAAARALFRDR